MTPEQLFTIAGRLAIAGWLLLLLGVFAPRSWRLWLLWAGGRVVPLVLCITYAACLLAWWGERDGGFESLAAVARLFTHDGLLLAGWIHYLAFDLLVGRWQVDDALAAEPASGLRWLVVPCLPATLMFGPAGLLMYLLLARLRTRRAALLPAAAR